MKLIKLTTQTDIDSIAKTFKSGEIIAYPTDTIYGLGCDATNLAAIKNIYKLKNRTGDKPIIILVKSYCMLKKYFYVSKKQDKLLRKIWQKGEKPTTVILNAKSILPKILKSTNNSAAVRMPINSNFLIKLLKKINNPITSTSLNLSGKKNITNIQKTPKKLTNKIRLGIDAGIQKNKESKILDLCDINNIKIVR